MKRPLDRYDKADIIISASAILFAVLVWVFLYWVASVLDRH